MAASLHAEANAREIALELARAMRSTDRVDSLCGSIVAPRQHDPRFADFVAVLFAAVFETKGAAEGTEAGAWDAWDIVVALCASLGILVGAAEFVAHSIVQLAAHSDEMRASTAALLVWMCEGRMVTVNSRHLDKLIVVTAIESKNEHLAAAMMMPSLSSASATGGMTMTLAADARPNETTLAAAVSTRRMATVRMLAAADERFRAIEVRLVVDQTDRIVGISCLHPLIALQAQAIRDTVVASNHWSRALPAAIEQIGSCADASSRAECVEIAEFLLSTGAAGPFYARGDGQLLVALCSLAGTEECKRIALGIGKHCLFAYIRLVYAAPRAAPLLGLISRSFVSIDAGPLQPRVPNALCTEAENDDDCLEVGKHFAARLLRADPGCDERGLAFAPMFIDHVVRDSRLRQDVSRLHDGESDRYAYYMRAVAKTREGLYSLINERVVAVMALAGDECELRERINGTVVQYAVLADVDIAPYMAAM